MCIVCSLTRISLIYNMYDVINIICTNKRFYHLSYFILYYAVYIYYVILLFCNSNDFYRSHISNTLYNFFIHRERNTLLLRNKHMLQYLHSYFLEAFPSMNKGTSTCSLFIRSNIFIHVLRSISSINKRKARIRFSLFALSINVLAICKTSTQR